MNDLLKKLQALDLALLLKINTQWTCSFFDSALPQYRSQNTWYALYLIILCYVIYKWRRKFWLVLLFAIITVAITDQLSSIVLKNLIDRVRPCNDPLVMYQARCLVSYRPQSASFPSSHASNHFAIAVFFYSIFRPYFKQWGLLFLLWAATIAYAQVYVGVHYPIDVMGGTVLGCIIGYAVTQLYFYTNFLIYKTPLKQRYE